MVTQTTSYNVGPGEADMPTIVSVRKVFQSTRTTQAWNNQLLYTHELQSIVLIYRILNVAFYPTVIARETKTKLGDR